MKLRTGTKWDSILEPLDDYRYLIPKSYKKEMHVDALIYSSPELIGQVCKDLSLDQAANVATLPGILGRSFAMPDMHQGYGFPIGGVAAMDPETGVVSPGGVGFDINCGVRLMASPLEFKDVESRLDDLVGRLFESVPSGAGKSGRISLSDRQLDEILSDGMSWAKREGYATNEDLSHTEESGRLTSASPDSISKRARHRGISQLGTLGSGNHFLEVDIIDQIFDRELAESFGLFDRQVCFMVHCGSRGLGHQVCTDYVSSMKTVMKKYSIEIPDRELACCPIDSDEGRSYLGAMAAAANFAFANRQCIMHFVRQVLKKSFGVKADLKLVYDVTHNMAKFEEHTVDGVIRKVLVHRKGATRAFPSGRDELGSAFRETGQPVIIPGDMGRASYILVGTQKALEETFGSVCHGAGRVMSRTQARKAQQSKDVVAKLKARGVVARASTRQGLTEEAPEAYKSIDEVIAAVSAAGLARPVARLKPIGVVKG